MGKKKAAARSKPSAGFTKIPNNSSGGGVEEEGDVMNGDGDNHSSTTTTTTIKNNGFSHLTAAAAAASNAAVSHQFPSSSPSPSSKSRPPTQQHDPRALIAAAKQALDSLQPGLARKFALRALASSSSSSPFPDPAVLECLGIIEMEIAAAFMSAVEADPIDVDGDGDDDNDPELAGLDPGPRASAKAERYFRAAVDADAGRGLIGADVFMYLGQLTEGEESLAFYEKGVERMTVSAQSGVAGEELATLNRKMSSALCSMAEIFMTDLCDHPEAEARSEALALRAVSVDPTNPEPHQTLASVRLSQCRPDDARAALDTSLGLWFAPFASTSEAAAAATASSTTTPPPAYPNRMACAKLLIELGLHDRATRVLETCQRENDEDPESWYLFAFCYYRMGGGGCGIEADAAEAAGNLDAAEELRAYARERERAADVGRRAEAAADETAAVDEETKVAYWVDARECLERVDALARSAAAAGADGVVDEAMLAHGRDLVAEIDAFLALHGPLAERAMRDDDEDAGVELPGGEEDDDEDAMEM
ncbi:hypothetical protein DFJ73DRAFT_779823 [Zopfochytrium polystomum]|nr:hypothetical protein DFJ73DRAFT_779823 [Zopfochytrium polystomum]